MQQAVRAIHSSSNSGVLVPQQDDLPSSFMENWEWCDDLSASYSMCRIRCPRRMKAVDQMFAPVCDLVAKQQREIPLIMKKHALITVSRYCACISLLLCSAIGSHCQKVSDPETRLASCRKQIDETDQQIVALLNQRARIVAEVGKIKREAHLPVAAPTREQQVLDHIVRVGGAGPLPPHRLRRIYQTVIQEMRTWEEESSPESEDKPAQ